jgi:hypothetical protein
VQAVLDRIDLQALIDRVDLNEVLAKVDINELAARLDLDALIQRIDVNAIIDRVDIEDLVARTEIGRMIMSSTTSIVTSTLDAARSTGVGLDQFMNRWVDRVLRRPRGTASGGPARLVAAR